MKIKKFTALALTALLSLSIVAPISAKEATQSVVKKHLSVGESTIHYKIHPNTGKHLKETYLVIHGAFMHSGFTDPLAGELSEQSDDKTNVVQIDLPSHGESTGPVQNSIEDIASIVSEFIEKAREEGDVAKKVNLVGWSMGGSTSLQLELSGLKGINTITLLNSGAEWKNFEPFKGTPGEVFLGIFQDIVKQDYAVGTTVEQQAFMNENVHTFMSSAQAAEGDLNSLLGFDVVSKLKKVKSKVLVISGDIDQSATIHKQYVLEDGIKKSELFILNNGTHSMLYKEPRLIAEKIVKFVK